MDKKVLHLTIVSQERALLSETVEQVTAPASEGEITVLPDHIPLMSKLDYGELRYVKDGQENSLVVSKGFINVEPNNQVTVMVDAAKLVREISLEKAQQAYQEARETMASSQDQREMILAEASLRQALWEIRVAQKTKKSSI